MRQLIAAVGMTMVRSLVVGFIIMCLEFQGWCLGCWGFNSIFGFGFWGQGLGNKQKLEKNKMVIIDIM